MIVRVKMRALGKIFGKINLKAIKNTFSPICGLWPGKGQADSIFWCGDIKQKREGGRELSPQTPPLLVDTDLPIRKLLKRVLGQLTVLFLKRVSETIYFKATNLQHRLKEME